MPDLIYDSCTIPFSIKQSRKAKNLRITVNDRGVNVTIPLGITVAEATWFVESKKGWILKKTREMRLLEKSVGQIEFSGGEEFLFQGRKLPLLVVQSERKNTKVSVENDHIIVSVNNSLDAHHRKSVVKKAMEDWYREQARDIITERLKFFLKMLRVEYNSINIRDQKTRWGSCSGRKNLSFNWRLSMCPQEVLDYVVVHELCHLIHMNHSKKFWQVVESIIPQYKIQKKWLKENSAFLRW